MSGVAIVGIIIVVAIIAEIVILGISGRRRMKKNATEPPPDVGG